MAFVIGLEGPMGSGKTHFLEYVEGHKEAFAGFGREVVGVNEFLDLKALALFYLMREASDGEFTDKSLAFLEGLGFRDGHYPADRLPEAIEGIARLTAELKGGISTEAIRVHTKLYERSCLVGRQVRHTHAKFSPAIYVMDKTMIGGAETYCRNSFEEGYLSWEAHKEYERLLRECLDDLDRSQQEKWLEQLVVYFDVHNYETALPRLRKRATGGEVIPKRYWDRINTLCRSLFVSPGPEEWYRKYGVNPPQVLVIDASVDLQKNPEFHARTLEQLIQKMEQMKGASLTLA